MRFCKDAWDEEKYEQDENQVFILLDYDDRSPLLISDAQLKGNNRRAIHLCDENYYMFRCTTAC